MVIAEDDKFTSSSLGMKYIFALLRIIQQE